MHIGFWWENRKERDHYEDLDVGERIILKWILMEWHRLALDRDQWRALMNRVVNLRVP
jgi:hypothetical protein